MSVHSVIRIECPSCVQSSGWTLVPAALGVRMAHYEKCSMCEGGIVEVQVPLRIPESRVITQPIRPIQPTA